MKKSTSVLIVGIPTLLGIGIASAVSGGEWKDNEATIPAGTTLVAALEHQISSEWSRTGDAVELRTTEPLPLENGVVVPAGIVIRGELIVAKRGSRRARPQLALQFTKLEIDGDAYAISAAPGVALARRGHELDLPVGLRVRVRLKNPVTVDYRLTD